MKKQALGCGGLSFNNQCKKTVIAVAIASFFNVSSAVTFPPAPYTSCVEAGFSGTITDTRDSNGNIYALPNSNECIQGTGTGGGPSGAGAGIAGIGGTISITEPVVAPPGSSITVVQSALGSAYDSGVFVSSSAFSFNNLDVFITSTVPNVSFPSGIRVQTVEDGADAVFNSDGIVNIQASGEMNNGVNIVTSVVKTTPNTVTANFNTLNIQTNGNYSHGISLNSDLSVLNITDIDSSIVTLGTNSHAIAAGRSGSISFDGASNFMPSNINVSGDGSSVFYATGGSSISIADTNMSISMTSGPLNYGVIVVNASSFVIDSGANSDGTALWAKDTSVITMNAKAEGSRVILDDTSTFDISGATVSDYNGYNSRTDLVGISGVGIGSLESNSGTPTVDLGANTLVVGLDNSTQNASLIGSSNGGMNATTNAGLTSFNGDITGAGGLSLVAPTNLTITNPSSYTGTTTVADGASLSLDAASDIIGSSSSVTVNGTLNIVQSQTLNDLNGASTGVVDLGASTITTANVSSGTQTFAGAIQGAGDFNKDGAGELVLSGNPVWTGATNINAGTLTFDGSTGATFDGDIVGALGTALNLANGFILNGTIDPVDLSIDSMSVWNIPTNATSPSSEVNSLVLDGSIVFANTTAGQELLVDTMYTGNTGSSITVNTDFTSGTSDIITINGSASGSTAINVIASGEGSQTVGDGILVVQNSVGASFTLANRISLLGTDGVNYEYTLQAGTTNPNNTYLVSQPAALPVINVEPIPSLSMITLFLMSIMLSMVAVFSVRKTKAIK